MGLLEEGEHKKALEHFLEALSQNPNNLKAQGGMTEAIKATNPMYRLFLKYSFFIFNHSKRFQWFIIIGFFLGTRSLRSLPFSTWVIQPWSNMLLRFHSNGCYLLDDKEKRSALFATGA